MFSFLTSPIFLSEESFSFVVPLDEGPLELELLPAEEK
jgi:hypothetical protein